MFFPRMQMVIKDVFRNPISKIFNEAELLGQYCYARLQLNHSKKAMARYMDMFEKHLQENRDKITAEDAELVEKAITSFRKFVDEADGKFSDAIGGMKKEVLDDKKNDALLRHAIDTYSKIMNQS